MHWQQQQKGKANILLYSIVAGNVQVHSKRAAFPSIIYNITTALLMGKTSRARPHSQFSRKAKRQTKMYTDSSNQIGTPDRQNRNKSPLDPFPNQSLQTPLELGPVLPNVLLGIGY